MARKYSILIFSIFVYRQVSILVLESELRTLCLNFINFSFSMFSLDVLNLQINDKCWKGKPSLFVKNFTDFWCVKKNVIRRSTLLFVKFGPYNYCTFTGLKRRYQFWSYNKNKTTTTTKHSNGLSEVVGTETKLCAELWKQYLLARFQAPSVFLKMAMT